MDEISVAQPPAPAPVKRSCKIYYWVGGVVLVILLVLAVTWFYLPARLFAITRVLPSPSISGLPEAHLVSEFSPAYNALLGTDEQRIDGTLISSTRDSIGDLQVVEKNGSFSILVNGNSVYTSSSAIVHVTRSNDGTRIAFAELIGDGKAFTSPNDFPMAPLFPKDWSVRVYEPGTKTSYTLGDGLEPVFVDPTTVAWVASAGIVQVNLAQGNLTVTLEKQGLLVPETALRSPNSRVIGVYDKEIKNILAYQVNVGTVMSLATLPLTGAYHSTVLSNDALYVVRKSTWGSSIMRMTFESKQEEKVGFVPFVYSVGRVLIGSL